jgi:uncharacterized protein (TIGR02594 family)
VPDVPPERRMTPWLSAAFAELERGVEEFPDSAAVAENPRIVEYHRGVGIGPDDETPWCAAFVNWCLVQGGAVGTAKPNARSYQDWGLTDPGRLGAVAVLWRGSPNGWQGHVGFVLDNSHPDLVYLLAGNQGDRVSVRGFPRNRLLSYRWPAQETR